MIYILLLSLLCPVTFQDTEQAEPEVIIEKYINAVGGIEKLEAIKTMQYDFEAYNTENGELKRSRKVYRTRPNIYRSGDGNSDRLMFITPSKTVVLIKNKESGENEERALPAMPVDANFYQLWGISLNYQNLQFQAEYIGRIEWKGVECDVIAFSNGKDIESHEYFAIDSGLRIVTKYMKGAGGITIEYSDFKEVDGLIFPHTRTGTGTMRGEAFVHLDKIANVEFNVELPEGWFDPE